MLYGCYICTDLMLRNITNYLLRIFVVTALKGSLHHVIESDTV